MAVTEPIKKDEKDADVERKLRLYGVIKAFRAGKLPSNQQIDETLKYVIDHSPIDQAGLSSEGRTLIQDVRDIIQTMRYMVRDKNRDELFQQFAWHTQEVGRDGLPISKKERLEQKAEAEGAVEGEKTKEEEAVQHLRTLLTLVLTNSEVRKLLSDFSIIGRDLLSRGLAKAAGELAPPKEQLEHVDKEAPEGFVTEGGRRIGTSETPVAEGTIPGVGTVKHHPKAGETKLRREGEERDVGEYTSAAREAKEGVKREAKEEGSRQIGGLEPYGTTTVGGVEPRQGERPGEGFDRNRVEGQARGIAGDERVDRAQDVMGETQRRARERGELEAREREAEAEGEQEARAQGKIGAFVGRMKGARDTLTDRIPEEHKDRLDRGKRFLTDEYFPEERREQFIYRGKKVILECQKHDDYKASIKWLLDYIQEIAERGRQGAVERANGAKGAVDHRPVQRSINELRTLLERFANNHSMDPMFDAFYVLSDDAKRDQELRNWFREVNEYVRTVLLSEGYILEDESTDRAKELREKGRSFYDVKYKSHFDDLFNSVGDWFRAMGEDKLNKRFGEDWARLTKDLLFDSEGSLKFKKHLWGDIRKIIVPQLIEKVGYLPIPRIEYSDPSLDLVVENLTLSGKNLLPNIVAIEAHNFVKFSPYKQIGDEGQHRFTFTLGQIQADLRDVIFYYKKKQGVPRVSDSGILDVVIGGEGMTITAVIVSSGKDRSSVFHVQDVNVKLAALKFSIREAKHEIWYKTLKPLVTGLIKKQIQKALADAVRTGLEYVDGQLVTVKDRIAEVPEGDEKTRRERLQELFSRRDHASEHGVRAGSISDRSATTTVSGEKHFKVVTSKRDSMLGDVAHPSGFITKTAEKDEEAERGKEWRSDAFTIIRDPGHPQKGRFVEGMSSSRA